MTYISKAQRQLDGDLLLKTDTQALLFRALQDVREHLAQRGDAPEHCMRALAAVGEALGEWKGPLPSANDMLGDPARERLARNLLKG